MEQNQGMKASLAMSSTPRTSENIPGRANQKENFEKALNFFSECYVSTEKVTMLKVLYSDVVNRNDLDKANDVEAILNLLCQSGNLSANDRQILYETMKVTDQIDVLKKLKKKSAKDIRFHKISPYRIKLIKFGQSLTVSDIVKVSKFCDIAAEKYKNSWELILHLETTGILTKDEKKMKVFIKKLESNKLHKAVESLRKDADGQPISSPKIPDNSQQSTKKSLKKTNALDLVNDLYEHKDRFTPEEKPKIFETLKKLVSYYQQQHGFDLKMKDNSANIASGTSDEMEDCHYGQVTEGVQSRRLKRIISTELNFRSKLVEISGEIEKRNIDLDMFKLALTDTVTKLALEKAKSALDVFTELENKGLLTETNQNILFAMFNLLNLNALKDKIQKLGFNVRHTPSFQFSEFRKKFVGIGSIITKIKEIGVIYQVPEEHCSTQWRMLRYLESNGKVTNTETLSKFCDNVKGIDARLGAAGRSTKRPNTTEAGTSPKRPKTIEGTAGTSKKGLKKDEDTAGTSTKMPKDDNGKAGTSTKRPNTNERIGILDTSKKPKNADCKAGTSTKKPTTNENLSIRKYLKEQQEKELRTKKYFIPPTYHKKNIDIYPGHVKYLDMEYVNKKKPDDLKPLDKILEAIKSKKESKILIEAHRGYGKTTLLRYISYLWATFSKKNIVFLVDGTDLTSTKSIFNVISEKASSNEDNSFSKEKIEDFIKDHQQEIVVLLDSADNLKADNLLQSLKGLEKSKIVISYRSRNTSSDLVEKFDLQFKINGYSQDGIKQFISDTFEDNKKAKQLLKRLNKPYGNDDKKLIELCRSPMQLRTICTIFKEKENLPEITTLVKELFCCTLNQEFQNKKTKKIDNFDGIPKHTKAHMSLLGKYFLKCLKENAKVCIKKKDFSKKKKDYAALNLLHKVLPDSAHEFEDEYVPPHKLIAELLAGFHIYCEWKEGKDSFDGASPKTLKRNEHLLMTCKFAEHFLGDEAEQFFTVDDK